ncbi:MAG: hypothetical protein WCI74_05240 [Actinomycetes bacterium]
MNRPLTYRPTTRDLTVIALVAVLVLVAKTVLRMPIKVSGHAGVLWIAALMVGRSAVKYPIAATLMGLLGGTLVAIFQPSDAGPLFTVLKYMLPGMVLDVLVVPLGGRFDSVLPSMLAGAAAHGTKVIVDVAQSLVAGITGPVLFAGLTVSLLLHIVFGALGGLIAAKIVAVLVRAQVPQMMDPPARGGSG